MADRAILVVDDEKPIMDIFTLALSEWGRPRDIAVLPAASAADDLAIREREALDRPHLL